MRRTKGIGEQKMKDLGERFRRAIVDYCKSHRLATSS
jgi:hypothetical protein